jgi:hypothetical protein
MNKEKRNLFFQKQYTNNCLTKKNENSVFVFLTCEVFLIDIYYYEKNYATKQSNQSQIHTQSWKIAQKVSKNTILKNYCQDGKK